MALIFGFVEYSPSSAMANCSKSVITNGWFVANNTVFTLTTVNAYAGETLRLTLTNADLTKKVWLQIGGQSLEQIGTGTLSIYFSQATSNVVVKVGGEAIYQPNHYYAVWYELDSLTPCRPIITNH
jgi:hypothetical protein